MEPLWICDKCLYPFFWFEALPTLGYYAGSDPGTERYRAGFRSRGAPPQCPRCGSMNVHSELPQQKE